jgi:hypothetical protein
MTRLRVGRPWFGSRQRQGFFLFGAKTRPALGHTQLPIQRVPGTLSLGVKRPGNEAEHSPPSSAQINNERSYTSTPSYIFTERCLVKQIIRLYGVGLT